MIRIDPDLAEYLEGIQGLLLGTVDDEGMPFAARGWGLTVADPARGIVRLLVDGGDAELHAQLTPRARVAITGTDVRTLQGRQAKGTVIALEPATDEDLMVSSRYRDDFFGTIVELDNIPRALLERMVPVGLLACTVELHEFFDQTPGPRAGRSLAGSA